MATKVTPGAVVADEILERLSACVLDVGELLDRAFGEVADFGQWVEDELPLSVHTAERVRAMWQVHEQFNGHCDNAPEPWKALWSLE